MRAPTFAVVFTLTVSTTLASAGSAAESVVLRGSVLDADSGKPLAARVYVQAKDGKRFTVESAADNGNAIPYNKSRGANSTEVHTALSAHPFEVKLPPGEYTVTAERGKEYLSTSQKTMIEADGAEITLKLKRWINMAAAGWYSGETHVHRQLEELPTAMLADDLNVALPLTYWVTKSDTPPGRGNKNSPPVAAKQIVVDKTHVIYPMNTEYEIFTVQGQRHALGAIFALGHKSVLKDGAPPVSSFVAQVRREGGLLELDKHNWPWSMMLVPVAGVDLYELTNNHIWRTNFEFRRFNNQYIPGFIDIEQDENGMTEKGWIDFTFANYYILLNCGFRLRPTGGTASGVHPVPLGFGRVYVHLEDGFSYDAWMKGLDAGRSFVTTGPMLDLKLDGQRADKTFNRSSEDQRSLRLHGWARSARPLSKLELLSGGDASPFVPANNKMAGGGYESPIDFEIPIHSSTWVAVRCWEPRENGRLRFAHSAPWHVDVKGKPLRPRRHEIRYLIGRVEDEIERHEGVLSGAALAEFRRALEVYRQIESRAIVK